LLVPALSFGLALLVGMQQLEVLVTPKPCYMNSALTSWVKQAAIIAGLFCLTLLYFSDVLTGKILLVERDLTTFFYPFRFVWVESVRQGHFPFWNPYIKCGVPLFASAQPAVLYPLSLAYLFLPLDLAFNWTIVIHFFLAGVFTYVLMRELGASTQGALCASLSFLFGGYLISIHNVLNTLISVSWYPLVMFCGCRMVRSGLFRWAVAAGASICCMFLGGGVEIVIFALVSLLILCLYPEILPLYASDEVNRLKHRVALLGLALVTFLGLSMVQFIPFVELYRQSHRYGGVPLSEATRWSLAPKDLIYFLLPDIYGQRLSPDRYWELQNYLKSIYIGPICAVLAAIYFFRQRKRGFPLLAAIALALIFALGRHTPLYPFFHKYFPLFGALRYPVKFIFLFVFWLCVAAGLGLDFIGRRFYQKRLPSMAYQMLLVIVAILLVGLFMLGRFFPVEVMGFTYHWLGKPLDPGFLPTSLHNLNRLLIFTILASMVIFFGLRHKLARLGSPLLLILLTLDLFLGNRGYAIKLDSASFHEETDIIRTLKADPDLFRFYVLPRVQELNFSGKSYEEFHRARKEFLGFDLMVEHHLFDIDGYNVPLQPRYQRFVNLVRGQPLHAPIPRLLNLLNVKYVLAIKPINLPGYAYVRDGMANGKLYENRNSQPRAFLVNNYQVLENDEEFARAFYDPSFDPLSTVFLERVPRRFSELRKAPTMPELKPSVRMLSFENNRIFMEATTPEAAFLFMSEAYYPGWQAYVDGRQEKILRANYVFRAIPLGPGSHKVEVVMAPLSFKIGLAVSVLTIVVLLSGWICSTIRKKRAWSISLRSQNSDSRIQEKTNQD
jgi:hypothetical protein